MIPPLSVSLTVQPTAKERARTVFVGGRVEDFKVLLDAVLET